MFKTLKLIGWSVWRGTWRGAWIGAVTGAAVVGIPGVLALLVGSPGVVIFVAIAAGIGGVVGAAVGVVLALLIALAATGDEPNLVGERAGMIAMAFVVVSSLIVGVLGAWAVTPVVLIFTPLFVWAGREHGERVAQHRDQMSGAWRQREMMKGPFGVPQH